MQRAVSALESEFPGRVVAKNLDATTPESKAIVGELGFQSHGLVIRSGRGEKLFSQPDHQVDMTVVHTELLRILAQR